jgi:hypothetical protein
MKDNYLATKRIYNQQIIAPQFNQPDAVVSYMVAMQAQDYAGAKWAIGLRMLNTKNDTIEQAINEGKILRTHLLRPTWHFVSPADIRWILTLTAPRIYAASAAMNKKFELDDTLFTKSNDILAKALQNNKQLTRPEIGKLLEQAGIATNDLRLSLLLIRAELDQLVCSGAREGKQFTYALLDDRAPLIPALSHEEALTKLAVGYFNSRGPATLHDFAYWAGLTVTDARIGLENVKSQLIDEVIDGKTYWMSPDKEIRTQQKNEAYLLPMYDEFAIAYKDRDALVNPLYLKQAMYVIFDAAIVVDNQVVGTWRRTIKKSSVDITLNLFGKLNKTQTMAIELASEKYQKFMF